MDTNIHILLSSSTTILDVYSVLQSLVYSLVLMHKNRTFMELSKLYYRRYCTFSSFFGGIPTNTVDDGDGLVFALEYIENFVLNI